MSQNAEAVATQTLGDAAVRAALINAEYVATKAAVARQKEISIKRMVITGVLKCLVMYVFYALFTYYVYNLDMYPFSISQYMTAKRARAGVIGWIQRMWEGMMWM